MKNNLPFGRCPFHNSSHHCVVLANHRTGVHIIAAPPCASPSPTLHSSFFTRTTHNIVTHTQLSHTQQLFHTQLCHTHTRTFHTLSHTHNSFTYNIVTYNSFKHTHPATHARTHARKSQHCHTQQLFLHTHTQLCHTSGDRRGLC